MDYNKKAEEIYQVLDQIDDLIYEFPLLSEMRRRQWEIKNKFFARINYNLAVHGSSPFNFNDIDN